MTEDEKREAIEAFAAKYGPRGERLPYAQWDIKLQTWLAAIEWEQSREKWLPIETRPQNLTDTYLVANEKGQVAPWIRGVIHNNVGTNWDWEFGSAITGWMPLPAPPKDTQVSDKEKP